MANGNGIYHLKPTGSGSPHMEAIAIVLPKPPLSSAVRAIGRADLDAEDKHIQFISRQHVEVSCTSSGEFFVTPVSRQSGHIFVNGICIPDKQQHKLSVGDTITLLGKLNYFNYVLTSGPPEASPDESSSSSSSRKRGRPDEAKETNNTVNKKPNGENLVQPESSEKVNGTIEALQAAPTTPVITAAHLEPHYECSICFEPLAHAHSVIPCGDNFCYICIVDWAEKNKKCPMCNATFDVNNLLPNRTVDNLIGEVLKTDQEKLQAWQQRCEEGIERKKAAAAAASVGGGSASKKGKKGKAAAAPVAPAARAGTRSQAQVAAAARAPKPPSWQRLMFWG